MKRHIFYLFIITLTVSACSKNICNGSQLNQRFLQKNDALINENFNVLTDIALPELSFVHSNGWKEDIHSFLTPSKVKGLKYKDITIDSIKTTIVGNTGLITGLGTFDINYKNNDMKVSLYFTETYVCMNKEWKLLSRHSCRKP